MSTATRPGFRRPPAPDTPGRVLLLLAHPALHRSQANAALLRAARGVAGVTVHDLYDAYPDFDVDVDHEQALLAAHAAVVLQFPFYWYSTPALLKQWMDLVLEFGWAFGPGGTALEGKALLCALTTGGAEQAYHAAGLNRFTMPELLRPLEQTAALCRMAWQEPFIVHGVHRLEPGGLDDAAGRYAARLQALTTGGAP